MICFLRRTPVVSTQSTGKRGKPKVQLDPPLPDLPCSNPAAPTHLSEVLRRVALSGTGVGFLACVDRSPNLVLLVLDEALALFDILRPL